VADTIDTLFSKKRKVLAQEVKGQFFDLLLPHS
jgi:hypothetical protein